MGIPILILGESGSGKSASLRNLDPDSAVIIQAVSKLLPFKSSFKKRSQENPKGQILVTDKSQEIIKIIQGASKAGRKVICIDDFQYTMANEFMRRTLDKETGNAAFAKYNEIAKNAWDIIMAIQALPSDVRVYILSHTQTDDMGNTKIKTIGKLLDEKITLEGLFTIVMRAMRVDSKHVFSTKNNGNDTVKTPMGMFDAPIVDNDLKSIDEAITAYYEI